MPTGTVKRNIYIPIYSLQHSSGASSSMIEIRVAKGESREPDTDFLIPHRKDYYLFVLVKKDSSRHWVDFTPYTLKKNTFYFTIPQQVHLKEDMQPMQGMIACFTEELLQLAEHKMLRSLPIIQNLSGGHELALNAKDVLFIEDLMNRMLDEFNSEDRLRNDMLFSLLRVLLIYLNRIYEKQFSGNVITRDLLKKFQSLIGSHYDELHDVAGYAKLLNLTAGHLNDVVKSQSGKTAIEHIHGRLIVEAKRRLLHTELTIQQIADELGFNDGAYFNRFFKRISGVTPLTYRKDIREMYH